MKGDQEMKNANENKEVNKVEELKDVETINETIVNETSTETAEPVETESEKQARLILETARKEAAEAALKAQEAAKLMKEAQKKAAEEAARKIQEAEEQAMFLQSKNHSRIHERRRLGDIIENYQSGKLFPYEYQTAGRHTDAFTNDIIESIMHFIPIGEIAINDKGAILNGNPRLTGLLKFRMNGNSIRKWDMLSTEQKTRFNDCMVDVTIYAGYTHQEEKAIYVSYNTQTAQSVLQKNYINIDESIAGNVNALSIHRFWSVTQDLGGVFTERKIQLEEPKACVIIAISLFLLLTYQFYLTIFVQAGQLLVNRRF